MPPDIDGFIELSGARDPAELQILAQLSGTLKDLINDCPDPDAGFFQFTRFAEVRGSRIQLYRSFLDHPALLDRFIHVVASSRYLADILVRNPDYLAFLADGEALSRPRPLESVRVELEHLCAGGAPVEEQLDAMRRLHRREVLRIGAAEILGFQDVPQATLQVSNLADAFTNQCLSILAEDPNRAGLIVLALGKWGGRELNYSSDVDVIFLARRMTDIPRATRLAQALIRALSEPTTEGAVYRVDLRLRPYGREGALVLTTTSFADYLRTKSHPAERQAMLKARAVAGDVDAGRRFLERTTSLVLKGGASARAQVRRLKSRIEEKLRVSGESGGHVKLAPGGIRDVEFLVQALQWEKGAARPDVLTGHTLDAIGKLAEAGFLAPPDAEALRAAYVFLRGVEHRLQLMGNRQVHRLPTKEDELKQLGRAVGFRGSDPDDQLMDAYDAATRRVRAIFDRILASPSTVEAPSGDPEKAAALKRLLGPACERWDPALLERIAQALDAVRKLDDLSLHARQNDRNRWTLVVAAADSGGFLPLLAGLCAARGVDIAAGDFLRLRFARGVPHQQSLSRKVLSVLDVTLPEKASPDFWDSFRNRLADPAAREGIVDDVADALRPAASAGAPLLPVRIEIRNDTSPRETELRIHSTDTLGFVFEFATALAALNVSVERAVIRTLEDEVYDTFWVTDQQGRKIEDAQSIDQLRVAAAMVKQFTHLLPTSPDPAQALRQFTAVLGRMFSRPGWVPELRSLESQSVLSTMAELLGVSRFLCEDFLLLQHENVFPVVCDLPALDRGKTRADLERELSDAIHEGGDPVARLNEFKDREMFRIDLRHITRRGSFTELMSSLSDLAEVVVSRAAASRAGGAPCPWSICALGKLGGGEMGFVSDLDLLFVYEREGETAKITHAQYFDEIVKDLRKTVQARREGSFGIDMRLRPHGNAGPWASSMEAFLQYYSDQGGAKPFERLAMVKLRPVAGDPALGARVLIARDAFVYSAKPVDYGDLLHLRKRQAAELVQPGEVNAKYSAGGLADVEYFIQAKQIEAGRGDPAVRLSNTLAAIDHLCGGGHLRTETAASLSHAYLFLRQLIDALRVVRGNAQDSKVPPPQSREFAYLARRLEYSSAARLDADIRQTMTFARNLWAIRPE